MAPIVETFYQELMGQVYNDDPDDLGLLNIIEKFKISQQKLTVDRANSWTFKLMNFIRTKGAFSKELGRIFKNFHDMQNSPVSEFIKE